MWDVCKRRRVQVTKRRPVRSRLSVIMGACFKRQLNSYSNSVGVAVSAYNMQVLQHIYFLRFAAVFLTDTLRLRMVAEASSLTHTLGVYASCSRTDVNHSPRNTMQPLMSLQDATALISGPSLNSMYAVHSTSALAPSHVSAAHLWDAAPSSTQLDNQHTIHLSSMVSSLRTFRPRVHIRILCGKNSWEYNKRSRLSYVIFFKLIFLSVPLLSIASPRNPNGHPSLSDSNATGFMLLPVHNKHTDTGWHGLQDELGDAIALKVQMPLLRAGMGEAKSKEIIASMPLMKHHDSDCYST